MIEYMEDAADDLETMVYEYETFHFPHEVVYRFPPDFDFDREERRWRENSWDLGGEIKATQEAIADLKAEAISAAESNLDNERIENCQEENIMTGGTEVTEAQELK